jgi:large subunit ribosomal protein L23
MLSASEPLNQRSPHHVIKSTLVTEKTTHIAEKYNCFVLEDAFSSNKFEIKKAVEDSWGVRVLAVRTQTRIGKARRHKSIIGVSRQMKLAFLTLHPDDRLNFV